jgi:galactokinase
MVGGGFGGSAIALAEQGQIQRIKNAITDAFKSAHYAEPRFFTSLPAEGAKVIKKLDR